MNKFLAICVLLALLCLGAVSARCSEAAHKKTKASSSSFDATCQSCEFFVQYIEGYLAQNQTVDQIVLQLEQICQFAPPSLHQQCVNFVDAEVPKLIFWIIATETPELACTQLGFCQSQVQGLFSHSQDFQECQICQLLIGFAESYINSQDTQKEILEKLESFCSLLPGQELAAACSGFVQNNLPQLIQELLNKETPAVACAQLGICQNAYKGKMHHFKHSNKHSNMHHNKKAKFVH